MAHGVTLTMRALEEKLRWRTTEDRPARVRDRSLNGKARIRARRAANKATNPEGARP